MPATTPASPFTDGAPRTVARLARPLAVAVLAAVAACSRPEGEAASGGASAGTSATASAAATTGRAIPVTFTAIGPVAARELDESSGLAPSRVNPGLFWTMNDDTDPVLFAIDTTGADLGRVRLAGARNVDWESMAVGPCGEGTCVYAGDTGDNEAVRRTRTIYRAPEPRRTGGRLPASVRAEKLEYRYVDGPKDVEAMYVSADGTVWLLSKRPARDSTGRHRPSLVYRLPASAWAAGGLAVAELVDSLPIVPGSAPGRLLTDASLSPDARTLAVRTYTELYLLDVDPATGRPSAGAPRRVCDLTPAQERQGEGIAWLAPDGTFLLSSEGSEVPKTVSSLVRARCGME